MIFRIFKRSAWFTLALKSLVLILIFDIEFLDLRQKNSLPNAKLVMHVI